MGLLRLLTVRGKVVVLIGLALVALAFVGTAAVMNSARAIEAVTLDGLIAIRESKTTQIDDYMTRLRGQATTLSQHPGTIDAMREFAAAFSELRDDAGVDEEPGTISAHYERELLPRIAETRRDSVRVESLVPRTAAGRYLQGRYIVDNPNPTGSKEELEDARDGTTYSAVHERYHSFFREYLREFGYYDIFLVDAQTGTIAYSVFKEIDFGTSLTTGPYNSTNFADVFDAAIATGAPGGFAIVDYAFYLPSYFAPAAFLSSPIIDDGEVIGALILQIPVDRINDVMTLSQRWQDEGLGATGESYLVGSDALLRSDARVRLNDENTYLQMLTQAGAAQVAIDALQANGSAILAQSASAPATRAAIAGETGTSNGLDALGREVIAAYQPIRFEELEWRVIVQTNRDEKFAPVRALSILMIITTASSAVVLLVLSAVVSASITRPLAVASAGLADIAKGSGDLTVTLPVSGRDEVSRLATNFNTFISKLHSIVSTVIAAATEGQTLGDELAANSQETARSVSSVKSAIGESRVHGQDLAREVEGSRTRLDTITAALAQLDTAVQEQSGAVEESSASIEEMASSIESVALVAQRRQKNSNQLDMLTTEGDQKIASTLDSLAALQESTGRIQEVSSMINQIAEQTNLLAMNAAIEAAHAGDAGRGFAVVAEEIRKLAETSATYADDINSELDMAVDRIGQALTSGRTTSEAFAAIRTELGEALDGFREIDQSVQELAAGSREMVGAITALRDQAVAARDQSSRIANDSESIKTSMSAVQTSSGNVEERLAAIEAEIASLEQRGGRLEELGRANQSRLAVVLDELGRFRV